MVTTSLEEYFGETLHLDNSFLSWAVNIDVRRHQTLENAGISKNTPVSSRGKKVPNAYAKITLIDYLLVSARFI